MFYWYFPTKHDLFAELVRSMRQRLRRAQAAALDPAADALTHIRQGVEASLLFMAEHAPYFALLQVERTDPHLAAVLREGSDVYLRDVLTHIREAQRDGQIADTDPTLLALGVLGAVSSFSNAWRNGRIELSADELGVLRRRLGGPRVRRASAHLVTSFGVLRTPKLHAGRYACYPNSPSSSG